MSPTRPDQSDKTRVLIGGEGVMAATSLTLIEGRTGKARRLQHRRRDLVYCYSVYWMLFWTVSMAVPSERGGLLYVMVLLLTR
ncbi:hypothetical protein M747DRAFT_33824 [Aspergillus niger ATCC 13496]|nr:hypothetical protein M747DRAFT_33824 [Aspergillus niger ATCC 13496]